MNAHDIPEGLAAEAAEAGARAAQMALLNREALAIIKMRAVLRQAVEQETELGLSVCAPLFRAALSLLSDANCEIAAHVYGGVA